jgi:tetratricopeptide (TPR) repeat protein
LDPGFFEAHMNYAAVNLQFRGFKNAQGAYERALKIRAKSYDALLGLSLALRGQAGQATADVALAKAEKLLQRAKKLDDQRPEAWFNEAILLQEFRSRGLPPTKTRLVLNKAKKHFSEFLARAKNRPAFADARTRAQERMRDIDEMLKFME